MARFLKHLPLNRSASTRFLCRQQQPVAGVLDQTATRLHQPLLQAGQRAVLDPLRQRRAQRAPPPQVPQVVGDRAQPQPHLVGTEGLQAGGQGCPALPDLLGTDQPEGRILGKALGPSRVLVAGQAAVDRLPQQISERKLRVLPPVRVPLMPISDSGAMPITVGA